MVIQSHNESLVMPRTFTNFNVTIIQKEDKKSWDKKWIKKIVKITFLVYREYEIAKSMGNRTKRKKTHYH